MINVAILSASRGVTLIKHFRKVLSENGGGKVFSLDVEPDRASMIFSDVATVSPRTDSENYEPFLIEFCKENSIDLLFSCRDEDLIKLSEFKDKLKPFGTVVMVADTDTIQICYEKKLFNTFCIENNFKVPKAYERDRHIDFPVFLKPNTGKGSLNTFKIKNKKMLDFVLDNFEEDFIIQKYIDEKEYTIDLFADFNGKVISVVPRERIMTVGGESYIGKTFKNNTIISESIRMSRRLGLVGHNTLQCFFDGNDVEWIEINPRFGGGANLGFESGHLTPEYLISLIKGENLDPKIGEFEEGLQMLRYASDVFKSSHQSLVKDKIFCIDIDGTICTQNCKYEEAKPIFKSVEKINKLHDNGNEIILYTSRGYYSGIDWVPLLKQQLEGWGVKYHKLLQGKPYADYYIDNKAINILEWV